MEIKVGIQQVARELILDSDTTSAEVEEALHKALADDGVLTLTDLKGRKVLVPAARIAYIDLGQEHVRPVGFGAV